MWALLDKQRVASLPRKLCWSSRSCSKRYGWRAAAWHGVSGMGEGVLDHAVHVVGNQHVMYTTVSRTPARVFLSNMNSFGALRCTPHDCTSAPETDARTTCCKTSPTHLLVTHYRFQGCVSVTSLQELLRAKLFLGHVCAIVHVQALDVLSTMDCASVRASVVVSRLA